MDATVEEVYHVISGKRGFAKAYPKELGNEIKDVSKLQLAMDTARYNYYQII